MELIKFDLILLTFKLNLDLSIYILPHSAPPNMDHYLFFNHPSVSQTLPMANFSGCGSAKF